MGAPLRYLRCCRILVRIPSVTTEICLCKALFLYNRHRSVLLVLVLARVPIPSSLPRLQRRLAKLNLLCLLCLPCLQWIGRVHLHHCMTLVRMVIMMVTVVVVAAGLYVPLQQQTLLL